VKCQFVAQLTVITLLYSASVAFAQATTPAPIATGHGIAYSSGLVAGDPDGALGRNYLVLKGNNSLMFIKKPAGGFSGYVPPPEFPDPHFQFDVSFWDAAVPSSQVVAPG